MRLKAGVTGLRAKRLEYIELQIRGEVLFEKDATMAVVAEGATIGENRLAVTGPQKTEAVEVFHSAL